MKNCILCPRQLRCLLLLGLGTLASFFVQANNYGPNTPSDEVCIENNEKDNFAAPFFTDPIPPDITVDCVTDIPAPVDLMADDDDDPSFPKLISPIDSPDPATLDGCSDEVITRTWTAVDMGGASTVETQIITLNADTEPPMVLLPEVDDTVSCEVADFVTWIDTRRLEVSVNIFGMSPTITDNCSTPSFTDDAPMDFTDKCGSITVTFSIMDDCGNTTPWTAKYTVVDTIGPELIGVPASLTGMDALDCSEPVPAPPVVTAMDACTTSTMVTFTEVNTQIVDGSCNEYEYTITRTWSSTDECGNTTDSVQVIEFFDNLPPSFSVPMDITIECDQDPDDLMITGDVIDEADNCDPDLRTSYEDIITPGSCAQEYTIQRTWRVRDTCGNVTGKVQTILVTDTQAPTFTVPGDLTVDCSEVNDLGITGEPTNVMDNCDTVVDVSFSDVISMMTCEYSYVINRTWRADDDCGNFTELEQIITVTDLVKPTFTNEAEDVDIECADLLDIETVFAGWIGTLGNASATDNCSAEGDLTWYTVNAGTSDPATLPPAMCPTADSIVRMQVVDFIVEDECGNRDTSTATFTVIDITPPMLRDCPVDTTVMTDVGECFATYSFVPPIIEDECGLSLFSEDITNSAPITSQAMPGEEGDIPVDPIDIDLTVTGPIPVNAFSDGTLTVSLINADAEEPTEFFNIYGEDGTFIGTTAFTPAQCDDSDAMFSLTPNQINTWGADGVITIHLEPNIPATEPGRFAINDICVGGGSVEANLMFTSKSLDGLRYEYSVNNQARVLVDPIAPTSTILDQGDNLLTYYATDCAGNVDSCSYMVTVEDMEAPDLTCPADIIVNLAPDSCTAFVTLPLPASAVDNCGVGEAFDMTMPGDTASAYLTFSFDPNLTDYVANDKIFSFTNVAANAMGTVELTLDMQGDFNSTGAFLDIYGDDSMLIGSTTVGDADCGTPGQVTFTISAATFNTWAVDGVVNITAEVNDIPVPPGVPGDGINPCMPANVTMDGDVDSVSYVFATLKYQELTPIYFAEGATNVPPTMMMAPEISPTIEFNQGETEISYVIQDINGNPDTCSYLVNVQDNQPPLASCQPTTVFINPSGLVVDTVEVAEIDAGSMDNCGIDTMFLTPNTFICEQAGTTIFATLTVIDVVGNSSTCAVPVRVEALEPMPTSSIDLCGGDSLFLFANPPPAIGGIVYTYKWTGPNGFMSTLQNPVIPNVSSVNAGSYSVEVTGITGCTSIGIVEVPIEDSPNTPFVLTDQQICTTEDIELTSSVVPQASNVTYSWYSGNPNVGGTLIGTTSVPSFIISAPHTEGTQSFYLQIEADGCLSSFSSAASVTATEIPMAVTNDANITICEGESITLGTFVSGPGIQYNWTGPNGFSSSAQFPSVINPATLVNAGVYTLTVSRNGCESAPAFTVVNITPQPATPLITNNGPVCEGEFVTLTTNIVGASLYEWSGPNFNMVPTATNTLTLNSSNANVEGNWTVKVTQFGCESEESAVTPVIVNDNPVASASVSSAAACEGSEVQLEASPNLVNGTYAWVGPNNFMSVSRTPVLSNLSQNNEGTYLVTVTTAEGCSSSASVDLDVLQGVSIIAVSNNAPACLQGPMDIKLTTTVFPEDDGNYEYLWTGPMGFTSTDSCATIPNATEANNGNYNLVVTSGDGCVSEMVTTVVDASNPPETPGTPVISATTPPPFCVGDMITIQIDSYDGDEVVYRWLTNSPLGVIQTTNPSLTINPMEALSMELRVQVIVDDCSADLSPTLPIVINEPPVISISSNSFVCEGDMIEFETDFISGAEYQWSGPSGFTSSVHNPIIDDADSDVHSGQYCVQVTENGCVSNLACIDVIVDESPMLPTASNNGPICVDVQDTSIILSVLPSTATPSGTYIWYDDEGNEIGSTTSLDFEIDDFSEFQEDGTYTFQVKTVVGNCESELSAPTEVVINTIPDNLAFAGNDEIVCEGDLITLNAEAPTIGTGLWTQAGGGADITNPNDPSSTITGMQAGQTYTFFWTLSNGACVDYSSDAVIFTVNQTEVPDAGEDILACASEVINLAAMPSELTAMWSQTDVQQQLMVEILDPADPNTLITGLEPGNLYEFTWTIEGGCGEVEDNVFVLISDPFPFGGRDTVVCNDEGEMTLDAKPPTEGSIGKWRSDDPNLQFTDAEDPKTVVKGLSPGENILIWEIDDGICDDDSRDTVRVLYKLNPMANPDEVIVGYGIETAFNVLTNDSIPPATIVTILDDPQHGKIIPDTTSENGGFIYIPDFDYVGVDEVMYMIESAACENSISTITFVVGDGAACQVPSIFTPNGDGINDFFIVPCLLDIDTYPLSQVIIFNQWGDEVFRSGVPYESNWDGTYDGADLPAGTYFYVIDYGNDTEGDSGFVVIQR